MTLDIIAFIIAILIYVPLVVAVYYTKHRQGKSYELLNGAEQLSSAFVLISFGSLMLDRFFDGNDSAFGWWLLAFIIGAVIAGCLNALVRSICERIWPKDPDLLIRSVKTPKGVRLAIDIVTALICLAFTVFFCYALGFHRAEMSLEDVILLSIGILIFAAGTVANSHKVLKSIRKRH